MRTGLPKQKKTTDIWFDEKDPLIHIRTHEYRLEEAACRLLPSSTPMCAARPTQTRKRAAWSLTLRKAASLFRLTAPYSEERREAARRYARESNAADRLK